MLCCKDQISFAKIVELSLTQHPAAIEGQKSLFSFSLPKKTLCCPLWVTAQMCNTGWIQCAHSSKDLQEMRNVDFPKKKLMIKFPACQGWWFYITSGLFPPSFVSYFISLSSSCNGNCLFDEIKIKGRGEKEKKKERAGHGRSCRSSSHGLRNSGAYLPNDSINWTK